MFLHVLNIPSKQQSSQTYSIKVISNQVVMHTDMYMYVSKNKHVVNTCICTCTVYTYKLYTQGIILSLTLCVHVHTCMYILTINEVASASNSSTDLLTNNRTDWLTWWRLLLGQNTCWNSNGGHLSGVDWLQ